MQIFLSFYLFFLSLSVEAAEYDLRISSDSPIAEGTSVTFNVILLKDSKIAPKDEYQFRYKINEGAESVRIVQFAFE